ncbi:MAG TPA: 3-hydroxyacyl-CoA dehydrogenase family protein [Solirubrobacterales bacterium]|nr:3-hydroxyacyl-CoA dehydrogenase family protein [Solirubrobacterales bacterium]
MDGSHGYSHVAIAGSGAIASGLAAAASQAGAVTVLARGDASASRAEAKARASAEKLDRGRPDRIGISTDPRDLHGCDLVVEAVIEDAATKIELLAALGAESPAADLATTTSSLSITSLARGSGHPDRVFGLHPFNPVARMELIELCLPDDLREGVAARARAWCRAIDKTPIEVPDQPGFVVNRLLFPYLFDAVRLMERTGMSAADVDACMKLGAGHPMGPLRLLDFVGLDVAQAIGESLHRDSNDPAHAVPGLIVELVGEGRLGRKAGSGLYESYDD